MARPIGVALLPGTIPHAVPAEGAGVGQAPRYLNRAWLLLPDGRAFAQDKLCLTPSERNPQAWCLTPGSGIGAVEW